ncbi:MAG TPA: hypothetical protein VIT44_06260 [Cyclobacteriaceae bacterium]
MKQHITLILLCSSVLTLFAQTKTITTGLQHPESVISDGNFFYATNIGEALAPMTKDGDGSIYRLSLEGKLIDQRFNKSTLNAPKGTAIINGILYVADIDRVVGIDIKTGKQVREIDLSSFGTQFLNDIAVKNESTLFVGSIDVSKIFVITLSDPAKIEALDVQEIKSPNGLYYNKATNQLFFVELVRNDLLQGKIGVIDLTNGPKLTYLSDVNGNYDGLQMIDKNTLLVSDWYNFKELKCKLMKVDIAHKKATLFLNDVDAADILYDKQNKRLLLPGLVKGTISMLEIK